MPRAYKPLSSAQQIKARALTAKGASQKDIARALGVAKQRVANYQKILSPKYRPRPPQPLTGARLFWATVKQVKGVLKVTHKEAIKEVYKREEWARKRAERAHKTYKSYKDFWKEVNKAKLSAEEREGLFDKYYGEEGDYVGGS